MSEYFEHRKISHSDDISFLFWLQQELKEWLCLSVQLHCTNIAPGSDLQADFKLISSKTKADFKGSTGGLEVSSCL